MFGRSNTISVLRSAALFLTLACLSAPRVNADNNLAAGRPYTLDPAPNYAVCDGPDDLTQLTDGKYVEGQFWSQPGTVGWIAIKQGIITIDLGKVCPISGISYSTAAGEQGIHWPEEIRIMTADEDKVFHEAGDLVALDAVKGIPDEEQYAAHRFSTQALETHGRYVALVVVTASPWLFCDEIEVYEGKAEWLSVPLPGEGIVNLREHTKLLAVRQGIRDRLTDDVKAVREIAAAAALQPPLLQAITAALDEVAASIPSAVIGFTPESRMVLPFGPAHARVFQALARVWQAKGFPRWSLWQSGTWNPLDLCLAEPGRANPPLAVSMMGNEYRAAAFNISLADPDAAEEAVKMRIEGLPGGPNPPYITLHSVAWTDTRRGDPVAAALPLAEKSGDDYTVPLNAGLTRQVWLTFHPVDLPPGIHEGRIVVETPDGPLSVPLALHLYPLRFPDRPTLHLGGWDYTNMPAFNDCAPGNREALLAHLRDHFVDSPWATPEALPFGSYDSSGAMTADPDTSNFDAWVRAWPTARQFCVFAAVKNRLDKFDMGTPEFEKAVQAWARFWTAHAQQKGFAPSQLVVLLWDEPSTATEDGVIIAWAKAIHAAGAGPLVWEDPCYRDMSKATPEMLALCDVLTPDRNIFMHEPDAYRDAFMQQKARGARLDFYSCTGPARLLDPYAYFRIQAWDCWRFGAVSSYFWSFDDAAGVSSWNEYTAQRHAYAPLFLDKTSVTPGKHMEACREGVEDYEYLVMLKEAVEKAPASKADAAARGRALLEELPAKVGTAFPREADYRWRPSGNPTPADEARIEILDVLGELAQ